jgi:lipid A 4'-phosphatase
MRPPLFFFVAAAVALALLTEFPALDLWVSGLFYEPGRGFPLGDSAAVQLVYRGVPYLATFLVLALLVCLAAALRRRRPVLGISARAAAFLLLALAIGPGILTNVVLKDHWGRARPAQIVQFGGTRDFTPAAIPANQCERNCSFTSGHAALGFYFVSFAFLARTRRGRWAGQAAAIVLGAIFGLARIAQGGHFLSDVVVSGLVVYATSWALYEAMMVAAFPAAALHRLLPLYANPRHRLALFTGLTALAIVLSIAFVDRPVAEFFYAQGETLHAVFRFITRFGVSTGWLIGSALLWLGLRIASRLPRFAALADRLRAYSILALFFFLSIAVPGIVVDILKAVAGRARPKLLFGNDEYFFAWGGLRADYWSFPSGHTATAVSIAAALSIIWPRGRPIFVAFAILIAASRIIITAHYVSDVVMATFLAIVGVHWVRFVFAQSGVPIEEARAGAFGEHPTLPWRERLGVHYLRRR